MALSHSPQIVRDGLVLYLDAANPKSYSGSGTSSFNLKDSSSTFTLSNGTSYSSTNNGYFTFDGVDDHIDLGINESVQISSSVTICAWIYITASTAETVYRAIIGNASSPRNYNFYVRGGGAGLWQMHLSNSYNGATSPFTGSVSSTVLSNNTWYYVTGVIDIENNRHKYYVNGNLLNDNGVTSMTSLSVNTNYNYYIGRADNYFKGNIALVKLYNRTLSLEEIKQNFEATRGRYGI